MSNGQTYLQNWYLQQCDGDWEHSYGIRINTLDNPGWHLTVDLGETGLADRSFEPVETERDKDDWLHCRVENQRFEGFCGPLNLEELLDAFANWASSSDT